MSREPEPLGEFGIAFLGRFLRGEWNAPSTSWVFRENWLVWHRAMIPARMLDREIEKNVRRATAGKREPWAWESLVRLYNDCRESGEPLPAPLQAWVDDVVNGKVRVPKPRGPKPDTSKHSRYLIAYTVLTEFLRFKPEDARLEMMMATDESEETIKSRLRRAGVRISANMRT